ncbi:hypothetical protein MNBD_NITROSPINAE01-671 [hydrothermal vent metagenome]|uniref:Sulphur oxidation protein SoxZ domain-containing protein n=1 Tax=hydrothermal vent metagenome TaxID=652676 RepID=A0A3B1BNZ7_9ZZZZ
MQTIGKSIIRLPGGMTKGSVAQVKSIILHPNDTGRMKDRDTGAIIPAYYVNRITVEYNGKIVYDVDPSPALSKDPYFAFSLNVGDGGTLKMRWTDNKGGVFEKSANVKFR